MCDKVCEEIAKVRKQWKAPEVMRHVNEVVAVFEPIRIEQLHDIFAAVSIGHVSEADGAPFIGWEMDSCFTTATSLAVLLLLLFLQR